MPFLGLGIQKQSEECEEAIFEMCVFLAIFFLVESDGHLRLKVLVMVGKGNEHQIWGDIYWIRKAMVKDWPENIGGETCGGRGGSDSNGRFINRWNKHNWWGDSWHKQYLVKNWTMTSIHQEVMLWWHIVGMWNIFGVVLKIGDPQVTIGFNTHSWSNDDWMTGATPMT